MLTYFILGATFAFAAAAQPGPFQAYLVSRTMRVGWGGTLPAAFAPMLTDGPIILLVLLVLRSVPARFTPVLQCLGGTFLLYLAWRSLRGLRASEEGAPAEKKAGQKTLLDAAIVNLLNPNPYLTWSLVLGPLLLKGWRESPSQGIALLAGFYGTLVAANAALVAMFSATRRLGPRLSRTLIVLSAVALAAFAVYELWAGGTALAG